MVNKGQVYQIPAISSYINGHIGVDNLIGINIGINRGIANQIPSVFSYINGHTNDIAGINRGQADEIRPSCGLDGFSAVGLQYWG
jgi:hypothetical protein